MIRVRFAPSPTGTVHIGNIRTALFNWLFARHQGGTFILRIEDTDRERSRQEYADGIMDSLRWLGLEWDEGPIYQSQLLANHQAAIDRLLATGDAYRCFCSPERLAALRVQMKEQGGSTAYDRLCLRLPAEEVARRREAGERYTIRFKVADGTTVFKDMVYGPKEFDNAQIGDFVIARSDGAPTFLLTCAVDDVNMRISHVIRGDDHLPNTPKQILIMKALGAEPPMYGHLPLIHGPDRSPLSKRHGATALIQYKEAGYLPEALVNFLSLLGWAYDETSEIFSKDNLVEKFSIDRVNRAPAVFNAEKLLWMNGYYIRTLPPDAITARVREWLAYRGFDVAQYAPEWLDGVIGLVIERAKLLDDFAAQLRFLLVDEIQYDEKAVKKHLSEKGCELLRGVREILATVPDYTHESLEPAMREFSEKMQVGFGKIAQPIRVALTGTDASPSIFEVLYFMGKEKALKRIDHALTNLCL